MTILAASLLLVPTTLVLATQTAQAFGWCADAVPGRECWSHYACIGIRRSYATGEETCQYGVPRVCDTTACLRDPCDWLLYCGPGPYLP